MALAMESSTRFARGHKPNGILYCGQNFSFTTTIEFFDLWGGMSILTEVCTTLIFPFYGAVFEDEGCVSLAEQF
jgi:hypothetical protein